EVGLDDACGEAAVVQTLLGTTGDYNSCIIERIR
ncbi:unnamed protein product, partial [marine sediment metagenome]